MNVLIIKSVQLSHTTLFITAQLNFTTSNDNVIGYNHISGRKVYLVLSSYDLWQ